MRILSAAFAALALAACATAEPGASAQGRGQPAPLATLAQPPAPPPVNRENQLRDAERALAADVAARGYSQAVADMMDPTLGYLVRPGALLEGAAAVDALRAGAGAEPPMFLQPDRTLLGRGGDMGVTSGRFVQVMRGQEAKIGRYVIVWRNGEDGVWRPISEDLTYDPPGTIPGPEPELAGARRRR